MKKFAFIIFFTILGLQTSRAQYFPIYSQYVVNGLVVNPAYTGAREVLSLNFSYRNQMIGIKGSPVYQTLSVHAPLTNPKLGLGFLFFNEKTGPAHNTHAFATYSYQVRISEGKLNFGLQTGIIYKEFDWSRVYLNDKTDPSFNNNKTTFILPNIGAGAYYYSKKFFVGLAIPFFLSYDETSNYSVYHDFNNYNFLLTAGYLFYFSSDFKLKPTTLVKYYLDGDEQVDFNMTAILFDDKFWIGGGYRLQEAVGGSFEVQLNSQFRLGYTFEYAGKNSGFFNYTSHEIGLRYEFSYKLKAFNPRYF